MWTLAPGILLMILSLLCTLIGPPETRIRLDVIVFTLMGIGVGLLFGLPPLVYLVSKYEIRRRG